MSDIALRCTRGAICARSLECEHSDSASLDYVASGSGDRAGPSSRLNGATTKRGNLKGCLFLLVEQVFRKSNRANHCSDLSVWILQKLQPYTQRPRTRFLSSPCNRHRAYRTSCFYHSSRRIRTSAEALPS